MSALKIDVPPGNHGEMYILTEGTRARKTTVFRADGTVFSTHSNCPSLPPTIPENDDQRTNPFLPPGMYFVVVQESPNPCPGDSLWKVMSPTPIDKLLREIQPSAGTTHYLIVTTSHYRNDPGECEHLTLVIEPGEDRAQGPAKHIGGANEPNPPAENTDNGAP